MKREFFSLGGGKSAELYTLKGSHGFEVDISDWGGTLVSIRTPDRNGKSTDVLLGFKDAAEYRKNGPYFGALIGRYANRISNGGFTLDGKYYPLEINEQPPRRNCLHGGDCYGRRLWKAEEAADDMLHLSLESPDGDAGFPGAVRIDVTYRIVDGSALEIDYRGTTDAVTVINMTNHAYFNLNGEGAPDCSGHIFRIAADRRTAVDELLAPTGENPAVEGTLYDLRGGKRFEEIIRELPRGFDDNFVLGESDDVWQENVAEVIAENNGITLSVDTNAPGVQFYMGGYLSSSITGKSGIAYLPNSAFCLETQLWPDAVHFPEFPSARIEPGDVYRHRTVYRFGVK